MESATARRITRKVYIGDLVVGGGSPLAVQSMCATRTQDIEKTSAQISLLEEHGADVIRIAVDSKRDVEALAEIRKKTDARLVIDLQENYRLIKQVASYVQKVRYNPGHLHHHEKNVPVREKVKFITDVAKDHDLALRIGVNFGSLDPATAEVESDPRDVALKSVSDHIGYMDELGFQNFVVSLKSSSPADVIEVNRRFSDLFPEVPIHLGVTEAGMLPMGEVKSRQAFEKLLTEGIGDTLRVSLTLPYEEKHQEILIGRRIIEDVESGRFMSSAGLSGLNIISCPSCSRVENEAFIELARDVKEITEYAANQDLTIAVMGCRVNGPGETDDADIGLWCAPKHVNLKRKGELIGAFSYDEVLGKVKEELNKLIAA